MSWQAPKRGVHDCVRRSARVPANGGARRPVRLGAPGARPSTHARPAPFTALRRDPFRLALFLLVVMEVSRVHLYLGVASLRPGLLLTAVACAYAIMKPSRLNFAALTDTWPAKVIFAFLAMTCISVPFGISVGGSAMFLIDTFSRTILPVMLIFLAMRDVRDLRLFLLAFVSGVGILTFLSLFVVGLAKVQGVGSFDPNDVGLILVMGIPLTLAAHQTSGKRGKIVCALILLGIGGSLALSESRGGFIGLLAVGAALLLFLKQIPVAKRVGFVVALGLALVVAAPTGYWDLMQTIASPTEDYNWESPYGRKALTNRGIGYMTSNPLTGLGVGNFPRAEGLYAAPAQEYFETGRGRIKWSVAHNSFVEAGAELGFPGLILFSALILGGIGAMMRMQRRLSWAWARGDEEQRFIFYMTLYLPIALIGFAVSGSFVSHTYSSFPYILAALVSGVYVSIEAYRRKVARRGPGYPSAAPPLGPPAPAWRRREAAAARMRHPRPPEAAHIG